MKKFLIAILILAMIISTNSMSAFAEKRGKDLDSLYINTKDIPKDMDKYARDNFKNLIKSAKRTPELYGFNKKEVNKFKLGQAFNIKRYENGNMISTDIFYLPILYKNNVRGLLAVTYDTETNKYIANLSKSFSDGLDSIKSNKSNKETYTIVDINESIYAVNENNTVLLQESPFDNNKNKKLNIDTNSFKAQKNDKTIQINEENTDIKLDATYSALASHVISGSIDITPVLQGDHPWCGAAATAAIINYKKGESLTAEDVTVEVHGSAVEEGITNSEVIEVASNHGLTASQTSPLSYGAVTSDIDNDHPIYMQMQRTKEDGTKAYHALVLRGYENYINYGEIIYSVINPWYTYYVEISGAEYGSQVTYITGSRTYKWYKTVRGF